MFISSIFTDYESKESIPGIFEILSPSRTAFSKTLKEKLLEKLNTRDLLLEKLNTSWSKSFTAFTNLKHFHESDIFTNINKIGVNKYILWCFYNHYLVTYSNWYFPSEVVGVQSSFIQE